MDDCQVIAHSSCPAQRNTPEPKHVTVAPNFLFFFLQDERRERVLELQLQFYVLHRVRLTGIVLSAGGKINKQDSSK